MRSTSSISSDSSSRIRLLNSIAAGGSTKSVDPVDDVSWTIPPIDDRASRRIGITYRPLRSVTDMSLTRCDGSRCFIAFSSRRISSPCAARSSRLMRRSAGEASSRTVASSLSTRPMLSSSCFDEYSRPMSAESTARATAGRRSSRKAAAVRRDDRSSTPMPSSSVAGSETPSTRSRLRAAPTSTIGLGCHGSSPVMRPFTAATRACSDSSQTRSFRGSNDRTRAVPSSDDAWPATMSMTRGNSSTDRPCGFTPSCSALRAPLW